MAECKDCLYSKRIDHHEHGSWHEYICKLHKDIKPGGICIFGCVPTRPTGTNVTKMREYLNKEFSNE